MTRGRRPYPESKKTLEVPFSMSRSLWAQCSLLMLDPYTGKTKYGLKSEIQNQLWEDWLIKKRAELQAIQDKEDRLNLQIGEQT